MGFDKIRTKILVLVITFSILTAIPMTGNALPAFPGAEGWGSDTVGGRSASAKLYKVNTLADSSSGSCTGNICTGTLRYALTASGPRIVIFTVGGTIALNSRITINNGNLTVAGQTAPGGGILIRNYGLLIQANDVIIRGLRIRVGDTYYTPPAYQNFYGINIAGTDQARQNIIIDHNSISWSPDEELSIWQYPYLSYHDITVSWNIFSEGLTSGEGHGTLIGDGLSGTNRVTDISIHHNLFANNLLRNPLIKGCTQVEVINNYIYHHYEGGGAKSYAAWIGNHWEAGPDSPSYSILLNNTDYCPESLPLASNYVSHNIGPERPTDTGSEWDIVSASETYRAYTPPFTLSNVTQDNVNNVKSLVMAGAGATSPQRDSVDKRIISEINSGGGIWPSSQDDVGGFPTIASGTYPTDTDGDGIPDSFEVAYGMNPYSSSDWTADNDGDGYLNIEEYINGLFPASSLATIGFPSSVRIPKPPSIIGID